MVLLGPIPSPSAKKDRKVFFMTNLEKAERFSEYMWEASKTRVQILKTLEEFIDNLHKGREDSEFDTEKSKKFFKEHACFQILGEIPPGWEDDMICFPYDAIDEFIKAEITIGRETIVKGVKKFLMGKLK